MERNSQTRNLSNDRGRWKRYHEPKFLRNERKVNEERLQQLINDWTHGDFRQKNRATEQGRLPTTNWPLGTMDSRSILGDGLTNSGSTELNRQTWSITYADPYGRRRN